MIESPQNAQVKNIIQLNQKAKARKEQGCFITEGRKMFLEAPPGRIRKAYLSESLSEDPELRTRIVREKLPYEIVSDKVFAKMSDTQTPQGILAVIETPSCVTEQLFSAERPLLMILEDLQDPGNLGTILRTAEGAGVTGVILTKKCVDITNPKVVRATMGSIYRMPFLYMEDVPSAAEELAGHGITVYAAHLRGKRFYDEEDYRSGTAFLIGNEGNGLSEEAAACADRLIRIPMEGQLESLNAAMAAGILMYEAARQRRNPCGK